MAPERLALDLPFDDLLVDDPDEPQSGLGRGLGAILADAAAESHVREGGLAGLIPIDDIGGDKGPNPTRISSTEVPDALVDDLVRALLDGLGSSVPLDLCAYLHQDERAAPRLHLRSPSLGGFAAADAFDLCRLLDRRLRAGGTSDFAVAGFQGRVLATGGPASRGVFAVGRRRGSLGDREYEAVEAFCRTSGSALHQLANAPAPPTVECRLRITDVALGSEATVDLTDVTEAPRRGQAWAQSRVGAVVAAVLDAVNRPAVFRYGGEIEADGSRTALVMLEAEGEVVLRAGCVPDGIPGSAVAAAAHAAAHAFQP